MRYELWPYLVSTLSFLFLQPTQIVLAKLFRWLHCFDLLSNTTSAFQFFHCHFHISLIIMKYVNIKLYTDTLYGGNDFTSLLQRLSL
ncbi:hypothetical protein K450DRAFT_237670 [Umbelopsis ramanniana AG]|uniref:Uncharacterized protein n=1 Tax=Umbelopsis ramanniana AG TaxID=1314678 RepID=A0AAD5EC47_UMBRA|nr:uncharacterized protein K450DRAFT_237670 [Umbelopsis ramanniana AG]KAI8580271.1 hypothetical protein K450DRAFT_237670 [Umbelopsis ramanniana AG]